MALVVFFSKIDYVGVFFFCYSTMLTMLVFLFWYFGKLSLVMEQSQLTMLRSCCVISVP